MLSCCSMPGFLHCVTTVGVGIVCLAMLTFFCATGFNVFSVIVVGLWLACRNLSRSNSKIGYYLSTFTRDTILRTKPLKLAAYKS